MSKEKRYSLEGKWVKLFLRSNWEFTGVVEYVNDSKVVLISDMGPLVIYKDNIVAAMILDDKKMAETIDHVSPSPYTRNTPSEVHSEVYRRSHDKIEQYDQYGSVIPEDMLEGEAEKQSPISFSLNMADLKNPKTTEEKYGSRQEAKGSREED